MRLPLAHRAALLAGALATCVALGAAVVPTGASAADDRGERRAVRAEGPLVFAHRGASGYRPEHTLAAYRLAIAQGADVIEPDLVSTKDGVLVARHENEISGTTDVAQRFPALKRTKTVDGATLTGWFTEDLTLAELRSLRAVERLPGVRQENTVFDGRYQVPTLDEVLALARRASKETGRTIGVAPETKHPTYFDGLGLSLEEPLLASLRRAGLDKKDSPVYVQSFEEANLRDLRRLGAKVALVQLTVAAPGSRPWDHVVAGDPETYADMTTPAGLREVATYADVLGPEKTQVLPRDASGRTAGRTSLVQDAHRAGLQVVPFTVRAENQFLPVELRRGSDPAAWGDVLAELRLLFAAGVDGVFVDQPDVAVAERDER